MNKFKNIIISLLEFRDQTRPRNISAIFFHDRRTLRRKLLIEEIFLLFKNEFILSNLNAIEVFFILKFGSFKSELFES